MVKGFRRLKRRGLAKGDRPVAEKLFMRLDPFLVRYQGDAVRISVKPREFLYIRLKYGDYQRRLIEEWRAGKLEVGEIVVNGTGVYIPFKKATAQVEPRGWIAVDVNETNVTAVSTDSHVLRFETNLREIRSAYFEKRRRIQELSKRKPKTSERLMAKYSERERNRVRDLLHKLSRRLVEFAKQHGLGIVLEDLKHIRARIRRSKRMNRRLHSLPFRRLQFYVEYKARLVGLPVVYVDPKHSSTLCPVCGGRLAPNGRRVSRCGRCGYESDRDVIACLNLLRRAPGCGEPPLPPKATEASWAEVERVVIKCRLRDNG